MHMLRRLELNWYIAKAIRYMKSNKDFSVCVREFIPLGIINLILLGDRKKFSLRLVEAKSFLSSGIISYETSVVGCHNRWQIKYNTIVTKNNRHIVCLMGRSIFHGWFNEMI